VAGPHSGNPALKKRGPKRKTVMADRWGWAFPLLMESEANKSTNDDHTDEFDVYVGRGRWKEK
jgi:hypothetical protein